MNWRTPLGLTLAASVFLTFIRPEMGNEGNYFIRFSLWLLQIGFAFLVSVPIRILVIRHIAPNTSHPLQMGIVASILAIPISLWVQFLVTPTGFFSNFSIFVGALPFVLMISFTITAIYLLLEKASQDTNALEFKSSYDAMNTAEHVSTAIKDLSDTALYQKLSAPLQQADLLALSAEDHYIKVHTSGGSTLILMRLSDAIIELEPFGLKVHRSWWVARAAVAKQEKMAGKILLTLNNGTQVPVSQSYMKQVQQENWS